MIPINLLIFDLDGTLIDTLDDIAASVNHALAGLGKGPISRDAVRRFVGDGAEMLIARSLAGDTGHLDQTVAAYKDYYRRNMVVRSVLYPGVRETLEYFKAIPLAVVSNKAGAFVVPVLEQLGIARYFKTAIGADHGLPLKPAPDSIFKIMAEAGAAKESTVIVGDGTADIGAGKAAGIITCAVTWGYRPEEELRSLGPDQVIHRPADLERIFAPSPIPGL
jgi:phosphoglycolate phosphatase